MGNALFDKMLVLAKELQNICELAYDRYLETGDDSFKKIAIMTGMLVCSEKDCKKRGVDIIRGKVYCKEHIQPS
jgi:hypothetical protein